MSYASILLVSHYTNTQGMVHKVHDYLESHYSVGLLLHPLYPSSQLKSFYKHNKAVSELKIPAAFQYPLEWIFNLYNLLKNKSVNYSLIICFDPLSFVNTFFYKLVNRDVKMVYYNLDYSKRRFTNPVLNYIYQKVNLFAFKQCDYFLCPTQKFALDLDPQKKMVEKCYVVPHTVDVSKVIKKKRIPRSVIYAGSLNKSVDFTDLFKACKRLEKDGIKYSLDIYGDGVNKENFVSLKNKHGLKNVNFKGTVNNAMLVNEILPQYEIGIAPYITKKKSNYPDHIFHGTDLTSKLVEYIAAGLPIVSTRLYSAFDVIEHNEFGKLVTSENDWYRSLLSLLNDQHSFQIFRRNALIYVKKYDANKIILPLVNKMIQPK